MRNITRKIGDLNEKLDTTLTLIEPRENAFLRYDCSTGEVLRGVQAALADFGSLSVSRTFPPLCTARADPASVHLDSLVVLITIDYNGQYRSTGGDPVEGKVIGVDGTPVMGWDERIKVIVTDNRDGTYYLKYLVATPGKYQMEVKIFGRAIKNSPVRLDVSAHHNPIWQFGSFGSDAHCLRQPVRVCSGLHDQLYLLDTGNNRIKELTADGTLVRHITGEGLTDQSAVGLALLLQRHSVAASTEVAGLLTLNWRSRTVTEWSAEGREVKSFTFSEFLEPIDLAVDGKGRILVADNGARKVFVFDAHARPVLSFPVRPVVPAKNANSNWTNQRPSSAAHVTCVAVGMNDDMLVGSSAGVQLYDSSGKFIRSISIGRDQPVTSFSTNHGSRQPANGSQTIIGGLAVDRGGNGTIVASVIDRNRTYLAVSDYKGDFKFSMDSFGARLKRPSGVCISPDGSHCLVAEVGNHCVKKYRFK